MNYSNIITNRVMTVVDLYNGMISKKDDFLIHFKFPNADSKHNCVDHLVSQKEKIKIRKNRNQHGITLCLEILV